MSNRLLNSFLDLANLVETVARSGEALGTQILLPDRGSIPILITPDTDRVREFLTEEGLLKS